MPGEKRIKVALLWHMHQPFYLNPETQKFEMPWVRLHGLKDYLDMPLTAAAHENVRVTFNLVPSLIDQIEMYCRGVTDRHQDLTAIPARDLNDDHRAEILNTFFCAHFPRMIEHYPRFRQLYRKKESCGTDMDLAVKIFSAPEWRDLQVWSNLTWIDPIFRGEEPIKSLFEKGRDFTEDDKRDLMDYQIKLLKQIIPEYHRLYSEGLIDVSFSPYYHPILPLLVDSDSAKEAIPDMTLPKNHFSQPQDADWQIDRSAGKFQTIFNAELKGMWPSEGSISEATLKMLSNKGINWAASDQGVLHYSLVKSGMDPRKYSPHTAYFFEEAPGTILFFRDHGLSDKIGFVYSSWDHIRAVNDFVQNLKKLGKFLQDRLEDTVIPIILDGENAWEYYRNDGTEFLKYFYRTLSEDKEIEIITFSEAVERIKPTGLPRIHAGSWINHDFRIWIGHPEDNAAWDLLYKTRQSLEDYQRRNKGADPEIIKNAWRQIYIAEGSDWCWWYGDDHVSENSGEFDILFRKHLGYVYDLLNVGPPPELKQPIHRARTESVLILPESLVTPKLDGRLTHYYEWSGAGNFDCSRADAAMHRTERAADSIYFAYDYESFYIRLDFEEKFKLVDNENVRIKLDFKDSSSEEISPGVKREDKTGDFEYIYDGILEIRFGRQRLLQGGSGKLEFALALYRGTELMERWPADQWIVIDIPEREKEIFWQV